jgi:hypothetical protein
MVWPNGLPPAQPIQHARAVRSCLPHYDRGTLKMKPTVALICAKTREQRAPSSLVDVKRCSANTKKCRVRNGKVVKVAPSGMARAWPQ